jgi:hypothetical protein
VENKSKIKLTNPIMMLPPIAVQNPSIVKPEKKYEVMDKIIALVIK